MVAPLRRHDECSRSGQKRQNRTQCNSARARNRIEATETEYFLGCDQLIFCRAQIQGGADGHVAEYDMSAK
jgi:cyanophycinase-like exopeptidase